jgi:hypothetical protein
MKKILTILTLTVLLSSCYKERVYECGVVVGQGIIQCDRWSCNYYLPVRFDNGITTNIQVTEYEWMYYTPGNSICRQY